MVLRLSHSSYTIPIPAFPLKGKESVLGATQQPAELKY